MQVKFNFFLRYWPFTSIAFT